METEITDDEKNLVICKALGECQHNWESTEAAGPGQYRWKCSLCGETSERIRANTSYHRDLVVIDAAHKLGCHFKLHVANGKAHAGIWHDDWAFPGMAISIKTIEIKNMSPARVLATALRDVLYDAIIERKK